MTSDALEPASFSESGHSAATRRRFRAGDMAQHLDMALLGELCLAVSVEGYKGLMDDFWSDAAGQLHPLLDALRCSFFDDIPRLAHSLKGVAASLGCTGVAAMARSIELNAPHFSVHACLQAAAQIEAQWHLTHALCFQAGFTRFPAA